jgi:hypothetical protein
MGSRKRNAGCASSAGAIQSPRCRANRSRQRRARQPLPVPLATNPNAPNASPVTNDVEQISGSDYFRRTIPRNPAANDLQYLVEWSSTLDPASWSATGLIIAQNTASLLIVRDSVPIAAQPSRLYRAKITKP